MTAAATRTNRSSLSSELARQAVGSCLCKHLRRRLQLTAYLPTAAALILPASFLSLSILALTAQVIKGWDEGVMKMSLGEKAVLNITSDFGYGERGAGGVIPPNADLVFGAHLAVCRVPLPSSHILLTPPPLSLPKRWNSSKSAIRAKYHLMAAGACASFYKIWRDGILDGLMMLMVN